jgi:pre-mRNA-splicing helicase BRR2
MGECEGKCMKDRMQRNGLNCILIEAEDGGSMLMIATVEALEGEDVRMVDEKSALIHSAALILDKTNMIGDDGRSGDLHATDIGRIASHDYVLHASMSVYKEHLRWTREAIDLFRLFSLSHEFRQLSIGQEERLGLRRLLETVRIPVREGADEPAAKVNALLQAHISRLGLEGFAMIADMTYVTQSAGRIWRAIHEMCLQHGWTRVARKTLDICKMVQDRQWLSMTPL